MSRKDRERSIEAYREKISKAIGSGGGCAEAWEASQEQRDSEESSLKRRELLEKSAKASAGGFTLSSLAPSATAKIADTSQLETQLTRRVQEYNSIDAVVGVLEANLQPILDGLYEEGHLATRSAVEIVEEPSLETASNTFVEANLVGGKDDQSAVGLPTASVQVNAPSASEKEVVLRALPAVDSYYALLKDPEEQTVQTYEIVEGGEDVYAQYTDCCFKNEICYLGCGGQGCHCNQYTVYCCSGSCTQCRYELNQVNWCSACPSNGPCHGNNCGN